ncbi:glycoside hydrolase family 3 N-terminal domain-containing protein [Arcobacter arenosus]|uniref:beta-N-acetylhexosaminidase n=1 Tax=Arcobacter arenosus TaxID=2576037 RepID=A0A5R8XZJ9_9BACT|nr:glycoside hydrolase family 3 N-terminal domain-containing protein [Arcobacter arenosus]TLP37565.1 glycoside hydrolase family 3 protein [Arcobacter arenosus]
MENLKQLLYKMLIIGFDGKDILNNKKLITNIQNGLGGVILFDHYIDDKTKSKNIQSPQQVKKLNKSLQSISESPLIICIDQEGGKVARLKEEKGFNITLSAKEIASLEEKDAKKEYENLSFQLKNLGINCNFAPLVDLGINKESKIIYGLDRAYGEDSEQVVKYAQIFMDALSKNQIISVLKHFPGHGSAKGDSHEGFVDITKTWDEIELIPYKKLLHKTKMIMSAHVYNGKIDENYPATLSFKTNTQLLRKELGFNGVLVTDDLQMLAIKKHYKKEETIELAINSGADILMYCNQLSNDDTDETIDMMMHLVQNKKISIDRIKEANHRINRLLEGI